MPCVGTWDSSHRESPTAQSALAAILNKGWRASLPQHDIEPM
jgi:hypothetical protein